jgi:hypothetical protein
MGWDDCDGAGKKAGQLKAHGNSSALSGAPCDTSLAEAQECGNLDAEPYSR